MYSSLDWQKVAGPRSRAEQMARARASPHLHPRYYLQLYYLLATYYYESWRVDARETVQRMRVVVVVAVVGMVLK